MSEEPAPYHVDLRNPIRGTVTARKCDHCGHHEIGVTTEAGEFIPLEAGMLVEITEGPIFPFGEEEEDEEDNKAEEKFELTSNDQFVISSAISVARRFLKDSPLTSNQKAALGLAIYALQRMPNITPGVDCEFGVCYRAGGEVRYIEFRISDSAFEVIKGGSVYDETAGSDSFSEPGWHIEVGGYANREGDLCDLENEVIEYVNLGGTVSVSSEWFPASEEDQK